jgi:hypothetical protein
LRRRSGFSDPDAILLEVNRQPLAGFWPTFLMTIPGTASWSSRPCNKAGAPSHIFIRTLHARSTHIRHCPREPRTLATDHQRSPANQVRSATASGASSCSNFVSNLPTFRLATSNSSTKPFHSFCGWSTNLSLPRLAIFKSKFSHSSSLIRSLSVSKSR